MTKLVKCYKIINVIFSNYSVLMAAIFINITREKLYKKYHMEGFTMQRFTLPRDLYHGKGALEALKSFEGKKAIICVGGGSMKQEWK